MLGLPLKDPRKSVSMKKFPQQQEIRIQDYKMADILGIRRDLLPAEWRSLPWLEKGRMTCKTRNLPDRKIRMSLQRDDRRVGSPKNRMIGTGSANRKIRFGFSADRMMGSSRDRIFPE
jgi:hypothetical protein